MFDRRRVANEAMVTSIRIRVRCKADLQRPICIYDICDQLGVTVRFNNISMEGMYDRAPKPRIHISSLRPLVRRNFNCAHELGHHLFGHGSTIDELREDVLTRENEPKEFLANTFSAYLLMPTLGIRHALAIRRLTSEQILPRHLYAVASNFGVGYATLVNHLAYGVDAIPAKKADALLRSSPKVIRAQLLGDMSTESLLWVDDHWTNRTIDAEVGGHVLLPRSLRVLSAHLEFVRLTPIGQLYRAVRPGIGRVESKNGSWAAFLRVARKAYVGLARYRHLEDLGDE